MWLSTDKGCPEILWSLFGNIQKQSGHGPVNLVQMDNWNKCSPKGPFPPKPVLLCLFFALYKGGESDNKYGKVTLSKYVCLNNKFQTHSKICKGYRLLAWGYYHLVLIQASTLNQLLSLSHPRRVEKNENCQRMTKIYFCRIYWISFWKCLPWLTIQRQQKTNLTRDEWSSTYLEKLWLKFICFAGIFFLSLVSFLAFWEEEYCLWKKSPIYSV